MRKLRTTKYSSYCYPHKEEKRNENQFTTNLSQHDDPQRRNRAGACPNRRKIKNPRANRGGPRSPHTTLKRIPVIQIKQGR